MKYLWLALLFLGNVTLLYCAQAPEHRVTFNNSFGLNWEQTLQPPFSNVRFLPPLNQKRCFDGGRGTIVVGLDKQVITMDVNGQVLQRFSMGDFDIQSVKYIEAKDGKDLIAVTSENARENLLKLSVFGLRRIKARF